MTLAIVCNVEIQARPCHPERSEGSAFPSSSGCKSVGARYGVHFFSDVRGKKILLGNKLWIQRQPLPQQEASFLGLFLQLGNLRPRRFRVDEILGHWRNPAPIINARIEQARKIVV